jgi:tRNA1(Val) A37 N6-methylase TrmN6
VTEDLLLGGRVRLRQPATGYRVAIDPVLLAAAIAVKPGERVLDMGGGVGAACLCLLARCPDTKLVLWEIDPKIAALARENAVLNGVEPYVSVETRPVARTQSEFDQVMCNPPYHGGRSSDTRATTRGLATVEADLPLWIDSAASALRHRGKLTLIFRADRLDSLLAVLTPKFGGITICPLWPREGEAARRVLIRAIKGSRAPLTLGSGLALHAERGYSTAATAILEAAAPLEF